MFDVRGRKSYLAMPKRQKVRYRDRIAALLALASAQYKDGCRRARSESGAYRCPDCGGWHLTSQKRWRPQLGT